MSYYKSLFVFCLLFFLTITAKGQPETRSKVNGLADLYVKRRFELFPEHGTFFGIKEADNVGLSDNSVIGTKKWEIFQDSLFIALRALDKNGLSKTDLITYEILHEQLEADIDCLVCKRSLWAVNHVDGWQVAFNTLANIQPVGSELSRKETLARWNLIPLYIHNEIENLKEGIKINYTAPKQNVQLVINQLGQILKQAVDQSFFFNPAIRDTNALFRQTLRKIIEHQIYPAVSAYNAFLTDTYLPAAREQASIATMPNGLACYKALLRKRTTLKITPDELYNEGVKAIQQREAKVKEIGRKIYGTDNLEQIKTHIWQDTLNKFYSKEEVIKFSEDAVMRAKTKSRYYFNLIPLAPVEIRPLPEYQKDVSPNYKSAPDDNSRSAVYYIQLSGFENQHKGEAENTAFHETYPGHHLQIGISRELIKSHPIVKYTSNSGFVEGWGRYSETLSDEMGLYSSDKNRLTTYARLPTGW
jgi:uncharacterized protein (DUF885 family)